MARGSREATGSSLFIEDDKELSTFPNILIVCEDTKSSKFYIEDYIQDIRLPSVSVTVVPGDGSAPRNVVNTAERYIENEDRESPFEYIFIVIDRDHHPTFDEALDKFRTLAKNYPEKTFVSILSYPSFETWILYHFEYSRSVMEYSEDVIKKIKLAGFDYDKASNNVFESTKSKMEIAVKNAKRSIEDSHDVGEPNPSTLFHELVFHLGKIKEANCVDKVKKQDIVDVFWQKFNLCSESGLTNTTITNDDFRSLQEDIFSADLFKEALEEFTTLASSFLEITITDECITLEFK